MSEESDGEHERKDMDVKIRIQRNELSPMSSKPFVRNRTGWTSDNEFFTEEELIALVMDKLKTRIAGLGSAQEDMLEIDIRVVDA